MSEFEGCGRADTGLIYCDECRWRNMPQMCFEYRTKNDMIVQEGKTL